MADLSNNVLELLLQKNLMLTTAESCTGGLIAKRITDHAGSSAVFERGFVTYSNEAKNELIGVSAALLKKFGAVSAEVAQAMAEGALKHSNANIAVSCTGIAGPGGGSDEKPVGLVYVGLAQEDEPSLTYEYYFKGDRGEIRDQTAQAAFMHILALFEGL